MKIVTKFVCRANKLLAAIARSLIECVVRSAWDAGIEKLWRLVMKNFPTFISKAVSLNWISQSGFVQNLCFKRSYGLFINYILT